MRYHILIVCVAIAGVNGCSQSSDKGGVAKTSAPAPAAVGNASYGDFVIGQPVAYENLTIFPVSSKSPKNDDRYLTLDEGLAAGTVKVIEVGARADGADSAAPNSANNPFDSPQAVQQPAPQPQPQTTNDANDNIGGDVNTLMVLNKSGKPLYLMPGEVISGGKQDRTIGQEIVIDSSDKPVPIDVFCVEHGRWHGRSVESTTSQLAAANDFNSNLSLAVSQTASVESLAKEAQGGRFVASVGQLSKDARLAVQQSGAQEKVWEEVAKTNSKVGNDSESGNFAANYSSRDVAKDSEPFVKALKPVGDTQQIIGVAVAVDGKMLSVDVFESTPLFKKFWPKLLKSYALDAVAAKDGNKEGKDKAVQKAVAVDDCVAFLKEFETAAAETEEHAGGQKIAKRTSARGASFSYYDAKAATWDEGAKPAAGGMGGGGGFAGSVHTTVLAH